MEEKKVDTEICGFCVHYDSDNCYCMARGEFEIYEGDTCDGFTPEAEEFLSDEEVKEILGDRKYHEKAEQGLIKSGEFVDEH